ncbi:unnamed protein product [Amoebophrya sp. A120]|nr:unnamed protein product [Amoebophrya sp. A120]|eukprot:GSA120T00001386001.1
MTTPTRQLVLGFDLSTQSCKAVVADAADPGTVLAEVSVNFETDLPEYATTSGFQKSVDIEGNEVVQSPVLMWVEAFETCLKQLMKKQHDDHALFSFAEIVRITGAAQQHGTVYLNASAEESGLDDAYFAGGGVDLDSSSSAKGPRAATSSTPSLKELVAPYLYKTESPIWMDMSTTKEVTSLENRFGWEHLTHTTGSRAYERFSGLQIAKYVRQGRVLTAGASTGDENGDGHQNRPTTSGRLAKVQLISNFMCSLCTGHWRIKTELSDAAGMNLLNLHTRKYDSEILEHFEVPKSLLTVESDEESKDSKSEDHDIAPGEATYPVSKYLATKYGFSNPACKVQPWTGDNCSAIVGAQLFHDDHAIVSLGTSDTLLFLLPKGCVNLSEKKFARILPYGHIFPHPVLTDRYFFMLCYSNGDVCRKAVRDACAGVVREDKNGVVDLLNNAEFQFFPAEKENKLRRDHDPVGAVDGAPTEAPGPPRPVSSSTTTQGCAVGNEASPVEEDHPLSAAPAALEVDASRNPPAAVVTEHRSTSNSSSKRSRSGLVEVVAVSSPSMGHSDEWDEALTPAQKQVQSWEKFDHLVASTGPGGGAAPAAADASSSPESLYVAGFLHVDEICPPVKTFSSTRAGAGVQTTPSSRFRQQVPAVFARKSSGSGGTDSDKNWEIEEEENPFDGVSPGVFCRGVLEARAIAMAAHARACSATAAAGSSSSPSSAPAAGHGEEQRSPLFKCITVAGGGARNEKFLQILANVFQCRIVLNPNAANLCAMGSVYRGCIALDGGQSLTRSATGAAATTSTSCHTTSSVEPDPALAGTYAEMVRGYTQLETELLRRYSRRV